MKELRSLLVSMLAAREHRALVPNFSFQCALVTDLWLSYVMMRILTMYINQEANEGWDLLIHGPRKA